MAPFPVPTPAAIPGMEEPADKPKPKPKREKSKKAAAVELPKVDETPFVPPPAILEKRCPAALGLLLLFITVHTMSRSQKAFSELLRATQMCLCLLHIKASWIHAACWSGALD